MSPAADQQTPKPLHDTPTLLRPSIRAGVAVLLLAIVVYTVWERLADHTTILHAAEIQTQGYARALKEHAERTFSETDLVLQTVIRQITAAGGTDTLGQTGLEQLLRKNAEAIPYIGSIAYINKAGRIQALSLPDQTGVSMADRLLYSFHRDNNDNRLFINPPFKSRVTGKWRFSLSRRLNNPDGRFAGIVAAVLDISYFEELYASLASDRNARYTLATIPGNYLVLVPNAAHVYDSGKTTVATFRQRTAQAAYQTYHTARSNIFSEPRIVSYHRLDRYPVVAIMSFNKNHVLAGWRASVIQSSLTTGFFILLILYLTRQLLKQVTLLDQRVQDRTAMLTLANRFLEEEIEERKQIEARLLEHQQKVEQMAHELALTEDRERGRVAEELHDQVCQRLILGKIKLDELISEEENPHRLKLLETTETLVEQSVQNIRTLTVQMRPPILANAGLVPAVRWLGDELQRDYGLEVRYDLYDYHSGRKQLKFEVSSPLFQIILELLKNVIKHAGVTTAWVSLHLAPDQLLVRVTDNGNGFDLQKALSRTSPRGGFGLHNIQQKIEYLGGTCLFDTAPGQGTCVTLSLPLKPELLKEPSP